MRHLGTDHKANTALAYLAVLGFHAKSAAEVVRPAMSRLFAIAPFELLAWPGDDEVYRHVAVLFILVALKAVVDAAPSGERMPTDIAAGPGPSRFFLNDRDW